MNKRRGSNLTRRNEHGTEERTKAVCCGAEGLGKKKGRQLGDGEDRLFMLGIWFTICQIFAFTLSSLKYSPVRTNYGRVGDFARPCAGPPIPRPPSPQHLHCDLLPDDTASISNCSTCVPIAKCPPDACV
jgi:hypothetical protein